LFQGISRMSSTACNGMLWYTAGMLYETPIRPELRCIRNFTTLMDLYERNYACLLRLVPEPARIDGPLVSRVDGSPDLHLQVLELGPYTTTLCLTYRFESDDGNWVADPGLHVRVYHDAKLAEALASRYRPGLGAMPPGCVARLPLLDWKWEINLFLDKWLNYCLGLGHRFLHGSEPTLCSDAAPVLAGT